MASFPITEGEYPYHTVSCRRYIGTFTVDKNDTVYSPLYAGWRKWPLTKDGVLNISAKINLLTERHIIATWFPDDENPYDSLKSDDPKDWHYAYSLEIYKCPVVMEVSEERGEIDLFLVYDKHRLDSDDFKKRQTELVNLINKLNKV